MYWKITLPLNTIIPLRCRIKSKNKNISISKNGWNLQHVIYILINYSGASWNVTHYHSALMRVAPNLLVSLNY